MLYQLSYFRDLIRVTPNAVQKYNNILFRQKKYPIFSFRHYFSLVIGAFTHVVLRAANIPFHLAEVGLRFSQVPLR